MDIKGETRSHGSGFQHFIGINGQIFLTENQQKTAAVSDTLDHMHLSDIFRAFHPKAAEHTFFTSAHKTCSRIDHMIAYKTRLNKF